MIARSVPAVTWGSLLRNALAAIAELLGHPTKPWGFPLHLWLSDWTTASRRESLSLLCSSVLPAVVFVQRSPRRVLGIPKTLTQNCVEQRCREIGVPNRCEWTSWREHPNLPF